MEGETPWWLAGSWLALLSPSKSKPRIVGDRERARKSTLLESEALCVLMATRCRGQRTATLPALVPRRLLPRQHRVLVLIAGQNINVWVVIRRADRDPTLQMMQYRCGESSPLPSRASHLHPLSLFDQGTSGNDGGCDAQLGPGSANRQLAVCLVA